MTGLVRRPDGARLAVQVAGPPPSARSATVVLAHGWTVTASSWRPVVERVRRARPDVAVVTYDHRDHGASTSGTARTASIAVLADDLAAVVEATAPVGPVVLGGHSMGGMAVLGLAGRHPDLVRDRLAGVLLVNTAAEGLTRRRPLAVLMRALAAAPPRLRVPRVPGPAARRIGYGSRAPRDLVAQVRAGVRAPTARSVGAWYAAVMDLDESRSLDALAGVPVAVLAGETDRLTPSARSRHIADRLPGATLDVVPGTGHMLLFEHPDAVTARLLGLLPPTG